MQQHDRVWSPYCLAVAEEIVRDQSQSNSFLARRFGIRRETVRRLRRDLVAAGRIVRRAR